MSFRSLYTCGLLLNAKLIISHHKAPYGHDIIIIFLPSYPLIPMARTHPGTGIL